jgi:hypothetical protein
MNQTKLLVSLIFLSTHAIAQQVYESAQYNAKYETPAGWVLPTPDTTINGDVLLKPNRVGLNPGLLEIRFFAHATAPEAFQYPSSNGFFQANNFMKVTRTVSTQAPIIYNIQDTTDPAIHYCYILLKQVDQGVIMAYFAESNRLWSHSFKLITTISDWNVNESLYMANWSGIRFISVTGPVTKVSAMTAPKINPMRRELFDLLGRQFKAP